MPKRLSVAERIALKLETSPAQKALETEIEDRIAQRLSAARAPAQGTSSTPSPLQKESTLEAARRLSTRIAASPRTESSDEATPPAAVSRHEAKESEDDSLVSASDESMGNLCFGRDDPAADALLGPRRARRGVFDDILEGPYIEEMDVASDYEDELKHHDVKLESVYVLEQMPQVELHIKDGVRKFKEALAAAEAGHAAEAKALVVEAKLKLLAAAHIMRATLKDHGADAMSADSRISYKRKLQKVYVNLSEIYAKTTRKNKVCFGYLEQAAGLAREVTDDPSSVEKAKKVEKKYKKEKKAAKAAKQAAEADPENGDLKAAAEATKEAAKAAKVAMQKKGGAAQDEIKSLLMLVAKFKGKHDRDAGLPFAVVLPYVRRAAELDDHAALASNVETFAEAELLVGRGVAVEMRKRGKKKDKFPRYEVAVCGGAVEAGGGGAGEGAEQGEEKKQAP
jgi:hypothetical protein